MDRKHDVLQKYFGYSAFRPGQEALIDALLAGRDALGVMPTGGGKSLCFQVPALLMSGVTLVISPLISLMKDQVMSLKAAGVSAAYLNSSLTPAQMQTVFQRIRSGSYKIIYVAPERLQTEGFLSSLDGIRISMIAVDEAHCISEWGQDFRPSYLKIAEFIRSLPYRPVVSAFTATATARVRRDILDSLELIEPEQIITGFDRPNLFYDVCRPTKKLPKLLELVREREGKSGIVYCSTRKQVEQLQEALTAAGISATRYHAGLPEAERHANQEAFVFDRAAVMVATNAFGMGIDKSNVSFVIHYNLPKSLEEYYQEAGRAGRDGAAADCILLFSAGDAVTARYLIENSAENEELSEAERAQQTRQNLDRLETMTAYCKTSGCLRGSILDYFGEAHAPTCRNCGNCCSEMTEADITEEAKMILSCVRRVTAHLGYPVGAALLIGVLRGSGDKRIRELKLDTLSTFGLLRTTPRPVVQEYFDRLTEQGFLEAKKPYNTVVTAGDANAVLFQGLRVTVRVKAAAEITHETPKQYQLTAEPALYERLRALRMELARAEGVPAYVVFSNATLQDMAAKQPGSVTEFLDVSGVGTVKAERYAEAFLSEIRRWREEKA